MSFIASMLKMLPDAAAQGLIWGILAIGVFITYKLLDFSDLTVDGSICTGGAVAALLIVNGVPVAIAMIAAFCAGALYGIYNGWTDLEILEFASAAAVMARGAADATSGLADAQSTKAFCSHFPRQGEMK